MKSSVRYGILGPVEVVHDGRPLALGGSKQRAVLAMLLLKANRTVSVDDVIDGLWGDAPPASAHKMVQIYVHRLRGLLESELGAAAQLQTLGGGYSLRLATGELDLDRFQELTARASNLVGTDPASAAGMFAEAVALFRGPALGGVASEPFAATEIARLDELRLSAVEARIDAELQAGLHNRCIGELRALVGLHPLRERFREQLMTALYRDGRQAEALEVYRETCQVFREELGVDPRPELARLHRAILRHELEPLAPPATRPPAQPGDPAADATLAARRPRRRLLALAAGALVLLAIAVATIGFAQRSGTVAITPNSVAVLDPASGRIEAGLPAGAAPGPIAASGDSVWVGNIDDRTVIRIDSRAERITKTFGLPAPPVEIVAGGDAVWIDDGYTGRLSRVLVAYDQLTAELYPGEQVAGEVAVASSDRALWVGLGDAMLLRLDPASLRLEAALTLPNRARAVALTSDGVWTIQYADRVLRRVDPATGSVSSVAALPDQPVLLASGYGSIWVATAGDDRLWRIDPSSGRVVGSTPLGIDPEAITLGAGAVWVAGGSDGTVDRIDATAGGLTQAVKIGRPVGGLAFAAGRLWATVD